MTLGDFTFDFVTEIEITNTWDLLTDTAKITIPKKIIFKRDNEILKNIVSGDNPIFSRGQLVSIDLGYDDILTRRFDGYISDIAPNFPIRLDCQDKMYLLKQTTVDSLDLKQTTLSNLLSKIMPSTVEYSAVSVNLGNFRVSTPSTVAQILDYIKRNYGLVSYIDNEGKLYSGLAYQSETASELTVHEFEHGSQDDLKAIVDDSDLVYKRSDDQKIKLRAVSIFPDNTKIEVTRGDTTGEQRVYYQYNVSEADLKILADEEIKKMKYEGFVGSFVVFGDPKVKSRDAVKITHPVIPDKSGTYLVKQVVTTWGTGGARQRITLDRKI